MNSPVAVEVDHQSVLLGWSPVKGALAYELQMLTTSEEKEQDSEGEWKSLSSAIQGTNIRKKNLLEGVVYHFRVRCKLATGWDDFSPSSEDTQVVPASTLLLAAPTVLARDTTSVTLQWSPPPSIPEDQVEGYRLRYRAEDSLTWTHVDTLLKNTQVKKKSLEVGVNYYFSVLPVVSPPTSSAAGNTDAEALKQEDSNSPPPLVCAFSPQSLPCQVQPFSSFMANLFPKQLVTQGGSQVDTAARLAGKMVAVYFSAHWCGPCRQFTPVLSSVYQAVKAGKHADKFEVVFCSADHAEPEFKSYFQSMAPWLAIDYEDDERESFMGTFKVQGIPKLVILGPDGKILTDSAAGAGFSEAMVEQLLKQCHLA